MRKLWWVIFLAFLAMVLAAAGGYLWLRLDASVEHVRKAQTLRAGYATAALYAFLVARGEVTGEVAGRGATHRGVARRP